ncbi:vhs domain-containing protein at3g16270 [Phtheirospermum japonicum]|uniref:Vhs domain-containing protein at3g16270 n=1 Tax=Phtheirospermum japonicum TaxID=374723 RepID=A0A830CK06_9LAMI|nr:vhs domain-containing protein at3g16270 [Phtheirospermum japonicum]
MDQSRRAVESYWRSKMVDGATSDEDKVTPVYKLEELCDLLRSSHVSIVKEVSEFILKRLEHKSPIVKQKALRVIKYAVGKSGTEFRREMQRNSIAVRQLIHYKGQPDPLKGDALNKAVRETAQEALSALFSSDESKAAPTESSLGSRIQGFGSTHYEMPSEDKKSFISEVVDIGSATIKQGLSSFTQSPSLRKNNDTGNYKSPNLRRSLTGESDYSDRYEGVGSYAETHNSSRFSKNAGSGNWGQDISAPQAETSSGDSGSTYSQKTREEKLLETIVTSGGVRLQPTRDALHVFLVEAAKLNAVSLGHAIETKLKSPMWQVRMKAMCILEAVLRKKDDGHFCVISSYFNDNNDVVVQCSESPQASLREKANKVLSLLGGEQSGVGINHVQKSAKAPQPSMMPDLIDTGDSDDLFGVEDSKKAESESRITNKVTSTAPLIDDLFGDSFGGTESTNGPKLDDDPFADVNFHIGEDKNHVADLFSGVATEAHTAAPKTEFDFFNLSSEASQERGKAGKDVNDLIGSLSINENDPFKMPNGSTVEKGSEHLDSKPSVYQDNKIPNSVLNNEFASQATGINAAPMFPSGAMGYNIPPGLMFNPAFASHPMNYGAMGSLFAQQQFLATLSNFQQLGNHQSNTNIGAAGSNAGSSSPYPDIFNPGMATQPPTSVMNDSKREDTKAFDFISDHVAAARDPKRVI